MKIPTNGGGGVPVACFLALLVLGPLSHLRAQPAFTANHTTAAPGAAVTVEVLLDNPDPVRGFSFGLTHDGSLLALEDIRQGAVVRAANEGAGAAFFSTDLDPFGGAGGTVGCILSLSAPLDDIPPGLTQEIVLFDYIASSNAEPAAVSALSFSNRLGSPPIEIVVSVAGTSQTPNLFSGSVEISTPAVTDLQCTISDACACLVLMTWTNPRAYDRIDIFRDGALVASLPPGAQSHSLGIGGSDPVILGVRGVINSQGSAPAQCVAECPPVSPTASPQGLSCSVDLSTCQASVRWSNPQAFATVDVVLDGRVAQTLAGSAQTAVVPLPGRGTYSLCVIGYDLCGAPSVPECCVVECSQRFLRGDANVDGEFDISDPILTLGFLFTSQVVDCFLALDVNDDDLLTIGDAVYALHALFMGGPLPPPPNTACGLDPTPGTLECQGFSECH